MGNVIRPRCWMNNRQQTSGRFDELVNRSHALVQLADLASKERRKLTPDLRAQVARSCDGLMVELGLDNSTVCRAIANLDAPVAIDPKMMHDLRLPAEASAGRRKELSADPLRYCTCIVAIYLAQQSTTGRSVREIADAILGETPLHPHTRDDLARPEEIICTLESWADDFEQEFGLLQAYHDISKQNAEQARLGSLADPWPFTLWLGDDVWGPEPSSEDERREEREVMLQRVEQVQQVHYNLWLASAEFPFSRTTVTTYFENRWILTMPRVYLGRLLEMCAPARPWVAGPDAMVEPDCEATEDLHIRWDAPHAWIVLYPDRDGRQLCPALLVKGAEWGDSFELLSARALADGDHLHLPYTAPRQSFLSHLESILLCAEETFRRTITDDFLALDSVASARAKLLARSKRIGHRRTQRSGNAVGNGGEK